LELPEGPGLELTTTKKLTKPGLRKSVRVGS
jgi:hypothetical protein